jgi:peptidoglycan/LPS O-acetylase OafA/YrhL
MALKTFQAGRALAAIGVAAFHLSIMMGAPRYGGKEVFLEYTRLGNLRVGFFFLLSGFIILFAHVNDIGKPEKLPKFIFRRFVRLFPIYWLYTLFFVLSLLLFGGTDASMPTTFADWITSLTLVRFTAAVPPLKVAWTLFHELAFYCIFALLIFNRRIGMVAFGLAGGVAILLYHFPAPDARTAFNVYTSAYNLYFLLGIGAFLLYQAGGKGHIEIACGLLVFVAAIASMPLPNQLSQLVMMTSLALLLAGLAKLEASGKLPVPSFLILIGDASYSIYLTHENFLGTLLKLVRKIRLYELIGAQASYLLVLVGAVALGQVAYLIIEKPLINFLRR